METSTDYKLTGEKARVIAAFVDQDRHGRKDLHYHLGAAAMFDELDRLNGAMARKEGYLVMLKDGDWSDELHDLANLHGLETLKPLADILRREIEEDAQAELNLSGKQDFHGGSNLDGRQLAYIDE